MYKKPTEEMILNAIENGWSREEAERGYAIFDFDQTGLLQIEKIDSVFSGTGIEEYDNITDEDCAREAEKSGFCKIIPVSELPENMRWYGWVDTPENRENIRKFFADPNWNKKRWS